MIVSNQSADSRLNDNTIRMLFFWSNKITFWYKQADVHDVVVKVFGNTAVAWNRITLMAHVRGSDVSNEFTVTEIFQRTKSDWQLLDQTFSKVRDTHEIAPSAVSAAN